MLRALSAVTAFEGSSQVPLAATAAGDARRVRRFHALGYVLVRNKPADSEELLFMPVSSDARGAGPGHGPEPTRSKPEELVGGAILPPQLRPRMIGS